MKALQKDRLHNINHYRHLLETDPAEADTSRTQMADHMRDLDRQLKQALDLLDHVPKFRNKVKKQIGKSGLILNLNLKKQIGKSGLFGVALIFLIGRFAFMSENGLPIIINRSTNLHLLLPIDPSILQ